MMSNCKNVMSFEKIKLRFFFFLPHPDRTRQQILDFWCLKDIYCLFKHNEYLKKKTPKTNYEKNLRYWSLKKPPRKERKYCLIQIEIILVKLKFNYGSFAHHATAKLSPVEFRKEKAISKVYQKIVWDVSFKVCRSFPNTHGAIRIWRKSLVCFSSGSV